jgi:hypothetical protein
LEGGGIGQNGIDVISTLPTGSGTNTLNIHDCVVKDFAGSGIAIQPTGTGLAGASIWNVVIADSSILENAATGINLAPQQSAGVTTYIYRTVVDGNATGINSASQVIGLGVLITDSHVDSNAGSGITVGSQTSFTIRSTTVEGNSAFQSGNDITNKNALLLYHGNTIGTVDNQAIAHTDGTNNIGSVMGTALVKDNLQ